MYVCVLVYSVSCREASPPHMTTTRSAMGRRGRTSSVCSVTTQQMTLLMAARDVPRCVITSRRSHHTSQGHHVPGRTTHFATLRQVNNNLATHDAPKVTLFFREEARALESVQLTCLTTCRSTTAPGVYNDFVL